IATMALPSFILDRIYSGLRLAIPVPRCLAAFSIISQIPSAWCRCCESATVIGMSMVGIKLVSHSHHKSDAEKNVGVLWSECGGAKGQALRKREVLGAQEGPRSPNWPKWKHR